MPENELKQKIKAISESPGVYLMKNSDGEVIYVGKAKNLKKRVSQYFTGKKSTVKTEYLVSKIEEIETIVSGSELDAFLLENNLIKQYKPRYNISLKDDKSYPFIKISKSKTGFPFIIKTRSFKKGEGEYFGPFSSAFAVTQTIQAINNIFRIRTCQDSKFRSHSKKGRPCLYYQINKCSAPCTGVISTEEYEKHIAGARLLLKGKNRQLLRELKSTMAEHVKNLNFESAIKIRDKINGIIAISEKQAMVLKNEKDIDIIGFYREKEKASIVVIVIRTGKVIGANNFFLKNVYISDPEAVSSFMDRYYTKTINIYGKVPDEIILPRGLDIDREDKDSLMSYIKSSYGRKVNIKKSETNPNLSVMATDNAKKHFMEKSSSSGGYGDVSEKSGGYAEGQGTDAAAPPRKNNKALEILKTRLNTVQTPKTIECFDISNISGTYAVASKAVLENGKADTSKYKRYKILTKNTPDDYAMMYEALSRRFNNGVSGKDPFPDIIMVDGGKGQLNVLTGVAREFTDKGLINPESAPVFIAIAKARDKDFALRAGLSGAGRPSAGASKILDSVYVPNRKNPVNFGTGKEAVLLLMRLRDEAHRFAVSYHSGLKRKALVTSELLQIKGVGPAVYKLILRELGSAGAVKKASLEDISGIKGINKNIAQKIYDYFREQGANMENRQK